MGRLNEIADEQGSFNMLDGMVALADGNPGAVTIMAQLVREDPTFLQLLDHLGIYGTDIWMLYKDECEGDMRKFKDVLLMRGLASFYPGAGEER